VDALRLTAEWPAETICVAVVGRAGVLAASGPSVDLPWASVTKMLTALVVLDAVQEGLLDLDEPAGPPGSTVRHLLAHASGLSPDGDRALAAPARYRIYSNGGFELLAEVLARRAGVPFADRLDERVLRPLGLAVELVGSPAHGAHGAIVDLAALGRELLAPTLLTPDLLALATTPAFPELAGVLPGFGRQRTNDWGLGFEIRDGKNPHWTGPANSPRTFGHFGMSGTFLWVDPDAALACACLTDRPFGPWASDAWPTLSDAVLREFRPPSPSYGQ